jgi:hypothetical protein
VPEATYRRIYGITGSRMVTTSVQRCVSIVMLLIGAIGGAVGGWFAHRAFVVEAREASGSSARSEVVAQQSESSARQRLPANSARAPSVQPTNVVSGIPDPARSGEAPLYSAAKSAARASTTAVVESAQSVAPTSQAPTLDDLLDSANIRCTFGPGNGGSWPQGKLTVGDAAWQGGSVDFQSIDYDAGTAQVLGSVARSRTGQMPVTVSTTGSGLNFTGMAGNGTLTVITMFSRLDNAGHHTAVLSMHAGTQDFDTAQFYGVCDSTLKRLN